MAHPEDLKQSAVLLERHFAGELADYDYECRMKHKDGHWVWVRDRGRVITRTGDGQPLMMFGTHSDITERKRAEASLRLDSQIMASMADGVYLVRERDGVIVYANDRFEKMFGYSPGELVGQSVSVVNAPDTQSSEVTAQAIIAELSRSGVWEGEIHNAKKDGTTFWCYARVTAFVHDIYGPVWIALHHDITDRKQASVALRVSEERFRLSMEATNDGLWDWNIQTDQGYFNPGYYRMLGYKPGDFAMSSSVWQALIHPADRERVLLVNQNCIEGRCDDFEVEYRLRAKTGDWRWILGRGRCIERDEQGRALRLVGTHMAISERKQAEAALDESHRRLKLALRGGELGMWDWDLPSDAVIYNELWAELLEYRPDEVESNVEFFKRHIHPEDRAAVLDRLTGHIEGRLPTYESEHRLRTKSGRWLWVLDRGQIVERDPAGRPTRVTGVIADITTRKQAELTLRESEATFRALADTIPLAIYLSAGVDQISEYVSPTMVKLFGYTQADIPNVAQWWPLAYPEETYRRQIAEEWNRRVKHSIATQSPIEPMETVVTCKDGAQKYVSWGYITLGQKNYAFGLDLTARKRAEEAANREQLFSKAIVDSIPGAFYLLDETGRYVRWNAYQRDEIMGQPEDQVAGMDAAETIHPDDRALIRSRITNVLAHGSDEILEGRVLLRGGPAFRWLLMTGRRLLIEGRPFLVGIGIDITERKQAEAALRESEDRFRGVVEGAAIPIFVTAEMKFSYLNPAALRLLGATTPEQVLGQPVLSRIHPDGHESIQKRVAQVFQGQHGAAPLQEEVYLKLDGTPVPVEATASPIIYQGQPAAVVFVQDITERKGLKDSLRELNRSLEQRVAERTTELSLEIAERQQTEERLRASEQRHRDLVETVPDWVWQVDEHGIYTFSGPQSRDLLGYAPEEILGRTPFDFMPPEEAQRVRPFTLAAMRRGEPIQVLENVLRRKDGRLITVETNGVPVRDAAGKLRGYRGLDHDITERRQAEVEHSAIITAALEGFFITDFAGRLQEVNDAYCRMSGYSRAELLTRRVSELEAEDTVQDIQQRTAKIIAQGHDQFESRHRRQDGTTFDIAVSVQFSSMRGGVLICFLQDITERKQAEAAMHAAKAAADAANLAKSRFLANMSHEIRTPMNAILGFSQLLLREAKRSGRCQPEHVATILRSGEHLLSIINDILEMARIESGRLTLNPAPFDLDRLLEDLERMLSLRVQTKQLRFQVERQGEVPRYLLADETKLRQVLINLLGNAVKFTPNGGAITLRVRSEPEPDGALRLHVEVADTGLGIAPEDVPQLFEPFFQTRDGQGISGGTGLGLPISREFVRLMGGELEVTSQVGVGSTFRFDVRVSRAQATAAGAERPSAHGSLRLQPGQPACRVLVVDDQPENLELLTLLLAPVGFEIRTAADGAEAVAQCQEWVPHLVLMDLRMPGMDGYETTRRIRAAHGTTVKIIALSAGVFIEDRQRAVAEGADAFLAKPFDHADLLDRIKELVGVDYVYDAVQEAAATVHGEAAAERPSAGDIRRLPADLVAALREATSRADYRQMLTLVEQAATHDERLGRLLRQLVKRFDHDTLQELLAAHTPNV